MVCLPSTGFSSALCQSIPVARRYPFIHLGRGNDDAGALYPTAQATNNERCPVHYYKKCKSIRPSEMSNADSPSNSAINYRRREDNSIWNLKTPLGKNEIGKLMKIGSTNHSIINENARHYAAQLRGHANMKSLDSYNAASVKHQRKMPLILTLSGEQSTPSTVSRLVQESSTVRVNLPKAVNPNESF